MLTSGNSERIEILSAEDVGRTLSRLASQILECVGEVDQLLLLGIPTRGIQLSAVLARFLKVLLAEEGCEERKATYAIFFE